MVRSCLLVTLIKCLKCLKSIRLFFVCQLVKSCQWLTESVTRSPIELFWTAKKSCITITCYSSPLLVCILKVKTTDKPAHLIAIYERRWSTNLTFFSWFLFFMIINKSNQLIPKNDISPRCEITFASDIKLPFRFWMGPNTRMENSLSISFSWAHYTDL